MIWNKTGVSEYFEKLSSCPDFKKHLEYAVYSGNCLNCSGIKARSWALGLCMECYQDLDKELAAKVNERFRINVTVEEKKLS